MRGFETLVAASVAAAGITQIGMMIARSSHHIDAIPVDPQASDCCQYRTWPVESSFWTFPSRPRFHETPQGLADDSSLGLFSQTAPDRGNPPADLVYSPAGRGVGPEVNATFPWTGFADADAAPTTDASNQAPQDALVAQWVSEGPIASSHKHNSTSTPTLSLFLAEPSSEVPALQNPEPAVLDSLPPPPPPDMIPPPGSGDLPPTQILGDLGGPGTDPSGGTTPSGVPEPATLMIVLTSLLGLAAARRPLRA